MCPMAREFCQTKGLGRVSIILFAIYYTYSQKEFLADDEVREQFIRHALSKKITVRNLYTWQVSKVASMYPGEGPNPRIHKNIVSKNQEYPDS